MKKSNKVLAWLSNPKLYFLLPVMLIAIGSTVGGTLIMTQDALAEYQTLGYVLLGIMLITLGYSIYGIVRIFPKAKERLFKWAEKHPRINKMFNHYGFTTLVTTASSLFVTFKYIFSVNISTSLPIRLTF